MSVLRKIDTFRRSPMGSVRTKLEKVYIRGLIERWSKMQLKRAGLLAVIDEFHKSRPPSSKKPVYADLMTGDFQI